MYESPEENLPWSEFGKSTGCEFSIFHISIPLQGIKEKKSTQLFTMEVK